MESFFRIVLLTLACSLCLALVGQNRVPAYRNPILPVDYSDPDIIRVGERYYMTASSFNFVPGLPILTSSDGVNWTLVSYALDRNLPDSFFQRVQHGGGVWAPSIRYINQQFTIFYPDPDHGIYKTTARQITGPWTKPVLVFPGKGLIDPCPIAANGKNYLVYALAGSRAGLKSVLMLTELNADMTTTTGSPQMIYDGHATDPTIEGPKVYQRKGWFYIFAPAGGVKTGWQVVLRSKNIQGPYERKQVLQQGNTPINGPHQGAWVTDVQGKDWFYHFQDKGAFGRVVHLQPMRWVNDWPEMGNFAQGKPGEPVLEWGQGSLPTQALAAATEEPFLQGKAWNKAWQWSANPGPHWAYVFGQELRLYPVLYGKEQKNLWDFPAWLSQKLPADDFVANCRIRVDQLMWGEEAGWGILGTDYARILVKKDSAGHVLQWLTCEQADQGKAEKTHYSKTFSSPFVFLRIAVKPDGKAIFSFSTDGQQYDNLPHSFDMKPGKWVGARMGFYALRKQWLNDAGHLGITTFNLQKNQ